MYHGKGSGGPCREDLLAYLAVAVTGIVLIALGVSPSALVTVTLALGLMYEKWASVTRQRGGEDSSRVQLKKSGSGVHLGDLPEGSEGNPEEAGEK